MTRWKYGVPEEFEYDFKDALMDVELPEIYGDVTEIETFSELGMLTMNAGVRITTDRGVSVSLTITSDGDWPQDNDEDNDN